MHRILSFLPLLFLFSLKLSAQSGWETVDSVTWQLYAGKQWESLNEEAKKAFNQEIDFFYLRVRAGVAAFEMKQYRPAIRHLQKALENSPDNEFVNSYYYSALLLAGREDEANALADRLPVEMLDRYQIRRKEFVSSVTLETLHSFNGMHRALIAEEIDNEGSYSNYRSVLNHMWFKDLGLDHHISPEFNLYHSFSHIAIDRTQRYKSAAYLLDAKKGTNTSQYQYFIQGRLMLWKGWHTTVAYSKVWGKSYYNYPEYQSDAGYIFPRLSQGINDHLVTLGIAREMTFMRPRISFTTGKINSYRQYQANGQIILYPLGNLHFYLLSEGIVHSDENCDHTKTLFTQKAGIKGGPLWLISEGTFGRVSNFSSGDGLVIYNMPETITGMYGATLWFPLFRYKVNVAVTYRLYEKTGTTFVYTDAVTYHTKDYDFTDQSVLISLKWNL